VSKKQYQSVRGTYDILPEAQPRYQAVTARFKRLVQNAGFGLIDTPMFEDAGVFTRSVGDGSDIVDKEMYILQDRGGDDLALRPEGTAGVVRAFIQHGMASLPKPVKLAYTGPMFRYERPQAGRYRQHTQLGLEVFGETNPSVDAQVILLALRFYRSLGLTDTVVQINSLGDAADRTKYLNVLVEYLEDNVKQLAPLDQERLKKNPLRVLDSKEKESQAILAKAPQILNYLSDECRTHLTGVLEYLDELKISYELNPYLVRGFDYASRTVFEFYGQREGSQSAIGGGCRYNQLVEQLGGPATPGVGFAIGLERVLLELEQRGIEVPVETVPSVYVASLGEPARLAAFKLIEELLDAGVTATGAVDRDGIGGQLDRANKLGVNYAIIIGQKEVAEQTVILRDMTTGAQEMIPLGKIATDMRKRFGITTDII
jgi:histidyl-tRNA synthetase